MTLINADSETSVFEHETAAKEAVELFLSTAWQIIAQAEVIDAVQDGVEPCPQTTLPLVMTTARLKEVGVLHTQRLKDRLYLFIDFRY